MTLTHTPQATAEAAAAAMSANDCASKHIGIELERIGPGKARMGMTVMAHLVNGLDVCHGGYIFSLADTAMAFASNSHNKPALAQSASITFLTPGRLGDRLTAVANELTVAGRTGVYDVEVRNQEGTLVAVFRGQTRTVQGQVAVLS